MLSIKSIYHLIVRITLAGMFVLPTITGFASPAAAAGNAPGAVFTLTNAASGNEVLAFDRSADGTLSFRGAYSTGGLGNGAGLGSQGAVVLSNDHQWLFAVDAGSSQVSVFAVKPDSLVLTDVAASGGSTPISLTQYGNFLYVLNAGGSGNIAGFALSNDGELEPLDGSTQPLSNGGSGAAPAPAQISFTPDGKTLVVSEKASNLIDTYAVENGIPSAPITHPSSGATPFGFDFSRRDTLVVSEAAGGQNGLSAVSSYRVNEGEVGLLSPSVGTTQVAACWLVVTKDGKYAFTTNAGSGSVASYQVGNDGSLELLNGAAAMIGANTHPSDMALSNSSSYLYTLNNNANTISIFQVQADGGLLHLGDQSVPAGAAGLAAY